MLNIPYYESQRRWSEASVRPAKERLIESQFGEWIEAQAGVWPLIASRLQEEKEQERVGKRRTVPTVLRSIRQ
jgi:hypothetical protein